MAAGDSALSICSDALLMIGAGAISSFQEGTDKANVCDRLYPDIKNQALLIYPWGFSFRKIKLARLVTTPTTEYKYEYQLPGDRIGPPRSVVISSSPNVRTIRNYRIFQDKLLTNEEEVWIDYQYAVQEFEMPVYFVQLMKYLMAWHLSTPITDQVEKANYWQSVAVGSPAENGRGGYMRTAMQIDGAGQPNQVIEDYSLIDVRY
jgi:hypothetical protein